MYTQQQQTNSLIRRKEQTKVYLDLSKFSDFQSAFFDGALFLSWLLVWESAIIGVQMRWDRDNERKANH